MSSRSTIVPKKKRKVEARIVCDTKVGNKKGEERRGG
jgi:hypothetical protein